ncbi:putative tmprss13 protein [Afipia carboxidovorans OM5]|nr:putative tmprss13 protein [Afipia carboxidovorans OM5]
MSEAPLGWRGSSMDRAHRGNRNRYKRGAVLHPSVAVIIVKEWLMRPDAPADLRMRRLWSPRVTRRLRHVDKSGLRLPRAAPGRDSEGSATPVALLPRLVVTSCRFSRSRPLDSLLAASGCRLYPDSKSTCQASPRIPPSFPTSGRLRISTSARQTASPT